MAHKPQYTSFFSRIKQNKNKTKTKTKQKQNKTKQNKSIDSFILWCVYKHHYNTVYICLLNKLAFMDMDTQLRLGDKSRILDLLAYIARTYFMKMNLLCY